MLNNRPELRDEEVALNQDMHVEVGFHSLAYSKLAAARRYRGVAVRDNLQSEREPQSRPRGSGAPFRLIGEGLPRRCSHPCRLGAPRRSRPLRPATGAMTTLAAMLDQVRTRSAALSAIVALLILLSSGGTGLRPAPPDFAA